MKERPIIFSGPMVRAILDGRKTQTRRVVKQQPSISSQSEAAWWSDSEQRWLESRHMPVHWPCPYGQPGDRLWVRETWAKPGEVGDYTEYRADNDDPLGAKWRPSIHMPRHVSRLTLEVTGVRVERLQEIKPEEALSEGCGMRGSSTDAPFNAIRDFKLLWDSINAKRGHSWESNPWVWIVEFEVAT